MELQKFNIESYIDWLKNISYQNEQYENITRYYNIGVRLGKRYYDAKKITEQEPKIDKDQGTNIEIEPKGYRKPEELADKFIVIGKSKMEEFKNKYQMFYAYIQKGDEKSFIPNNKEWKDIDNRVGSYLDRKIKDLEKRINEGFISELEILTEDLEVVNNNAKVKLLDTYRNFTPLPNYPKSREGMIGSFVFDIIQIKYAVYVNGKLEDFKLKTSQEENSKLEWDCQSMVLGYVFRELIDNHYIKPPLKTDGEVNQAKVAGILSKIFKFSESTLKQVLNPDYTRRLLNERELKEKISIQPKISLKIKDLKS